jgi:5-methyltetrahydropteroyltriglutamate--homocysteine methyltransferase
VSTPFRTTPVGSYPRPVRPEDTLKKPSISRQEADDLIRWAVQEQVAAGLDVVADGEGRRENMYYFLQKRIDGFDFDHMEYRSYGSSGFGIEVPRVSGPVGNPHVELAHDWRVARAAAPPSVAVKLTVAGPHLLAKFCLNEHYPSDRELGLAVADALRAELQEVVRAGCEFIQLDEPGWTAFPDEVPWAVELLNRVVDGLGVRIGLHVCGGNPRRKRVYFTRYQELAVGFRAAHVDQLVLEYATLDYDSLGLFADWDYRGEFAAGVIDPRSDAIESPELIAERGRALLAHFPAERLLLTSECGFGHVPLEITRAKLRSLVAGAAQLRGTLTLT